MLVDLAVRGVFESSGERFGVGWNHQGEVPMALVQKVANRANATGKQIVSWTPIERVLAVACAFSPLVMALVDKDPLRPSISHYYSMSENQLFYVPLAIAAMLFIVNGITKQSHHYNLVLGIALLGVILFNLIDFSGVHRVFAISFFVGNVIVMWWFSDLGVSTTKFRGWFVVLIAAVLAAWAVFDGFTLFWAEQMSLLVIAAHFWLDSKESVQWFNAVERGVYPWTKTQKG